MKASLSALKAHLKERAVLLKNLKQERKTRANGYVEELWGEKLSFRAHHIVYCMMRGRTLEEIENHRIDNPPPADCFTEKLLRKQMQAIAEKYKPVEVSEDSNVLRA